MPVLAVACAETAPKSEAPATTAGTVPFALAETPGNPYLVSTTGYGDYLAGLIAGHRNDLSSAADFMLQALEYDPDNGALLRRAFHLVAADGRHQESLVLANRVIVKYPEEPIANLVLVVSEIDKGNLETAHARLETLPDRGLESILAPMLQGWIRLGQDQVSAAAESFRPVREREGIALLGHMHTALLYDVAGDIDMADASYQAALDINSDRSLRLTRLVANFYRRSARDEDARILFESLNGANGGSSLLDAYAPESTFEATPEPIIGTYRDGLAEVLFNLAGLLSQERAEDVALIYAHQALVLRPDFVSAQMLLGEILERQGRDEEAIAAYRAVDPEASLAWIARLRISEALERMERIDDAIRELEQMAEERPDNFEPLYRVGGLLRSQERFEEAVVVYDRAVERLGEPAPRHWSLLYFRGIALERSGDWPRAEQDFLKALELQPEQPYVMNYLAYSWVEQKLNLEKAEDMLIRAVELRPSDGYIVDSLGWVYYRLGQYDKAVTNLERAVELRPQDPVINDHLGDAYWRVGRRQEARFQWRRALSLDPEVDLVPIIDAKLVDGLDADPENI